MKPDALTLTDQEIEILLSVQKFTVKRGSYKDFKENYCNYFNVVKFKYNFCLFKFCPVFIIFNASPNFNIANDGWFCHRKSINMYIRS